MSKKNENMLSKTKMKTNSKTSKDIIIESTVESATESAIKAMNQLTIKPEMQKEIIRTVRHRVIRGGAGRIGNIGRRFATGAAILIISLCVAAIPVSAYVISVVKERMRLMPQEEVTDLLQTMDAQEVGADSFSRDYTKTELNRMKELQMAYQKGTFPEGKLLQTEEEAENLQHDLYYLKSNSYFHLPDREMNDEELLQIIDFNAKRDYSLQQRYEEKLADMPESVYEAGFPEGDFPEAEELASGDKVLDESKYDIDYSQYVDENGMPDVDAENKAFKEMEKIAKADIIAVGGLDEYEAIETAKAWLSGLFGLTADGREIFCYLDLDIRPLAYHITFSVQSHEAHAFDIKGTDGTLVGLYYSGDLIDFDEERLPPAAADAKLQETYALAEKFLQDKLGIEEEYQAVYSYYESIDRLDDESDVEKVRYNELAIQFVTADGYAYQLSYHFPDGLFTRYEIISDYDHDSYIREKTENNKAYDRFAERHGDHIRTALHSAQLY